MIPRIALVLVVLGLVAAAPSRAGAPPANTDILHRLMDEPVTLFDWGLQQLDRDIERAARRTLPQRLGIGAATPVTGTIYTWRKRRITVYISVAMPRSQRTEAACTQLFGDVVADLTAGAPSGPNAAGWYLKNAFKPRAHFWGDRFEDVGAKLLTFVHLEIQFIPAEFEALRGDSRRVRCAGRLDAAADDLAIDITS